MAIGAEGHGPHPILVCHAGHLSPCGRFPHPGGAILAPRGQPLAIGAEGHGHYWPLVGHEGHFFAGGRVPHPRRA